MPWTVRRRSVLAILATLLLASLSTTCSPPVPPRSLRISGSNTVFNYAQQLADGFHAVDPTVTFRITSDGTARGIKWAGEGEVSGLTGPLTPPHAYSIPAGATGATTNGEHVDIGLSSRGLLNEEIEAYATLQATTFAFDAIGVVTNRGVTGVTNLTRANLRDIYAGRVTNWMTYGGPDLAIVVIARNAVSGTAGAWRDLVMGTDSVTSSAREVQYDTDTPPLIQSTPGSIGYLSSSLADATTMNVLQVEGFAPTQENVRSGAYSLQRPFVFVTNTTPTPLQRAFIDFALSPAGAQIIQAAGAVPVGGP